MHIHFIAIGGAVMHNLAIALAEAGHQVSGSDDEIYDPARSRLAAHGLLPPQTGWLIERIAPNLDYIVLGMHARKDNPEVQRAQQLGIPLLSYPALIGKYAADKTRIVVAGSHGKTTTTAMIMNLLHQAGKDFDYLVGAKVEGFENMVRLSNAPYIVIEGDEYLSSPLDPRPKFLHYQPHFLILTGIAWDHINVFPTFENYLSQFRNLLNSLPEKATVIYDERDAHLREILPEANPDSVWIPYRPLPHRVDKSQVVLTLPKTGDVPLQIFGEHNLANLAAAWELSRQLHIEPSVFAKAAAGFKGAERRLEPLVRSPHFSAWLDFAHAPSKVAATVKAVKALYPDRPLTACLELHTYSSLNHAFLPHYRNALLPADEAVVFYSLHTLQMKKMPLLEPSEIRAAFGQPQLHIITDSAELDHFLRLRQWRNRNLLLMSSGTFGGLDLRKIAKELGGESETPFKH